MLCVSYTTAQHLYLLIIKPCAVPYATDRVAVGFVSIVDSWIGARALLGDSYLYIRLPIV
jgi:hypothetical protein